MREKMKAVLEAVDDLFSDTSVPAEVTLDNLEEVRAEIDFKIGAIKEDLKRRES